MKCHYDVLDVPKDADDTQIKAAYRKLALKWHPDKNLNNAEDAKAEFQLVQQAYEVLSDRQERAWYDKHREQILYGNNVEYSSDLNIFQYFTTSCFKGYGDDQTGFYTIYRKAFEEIVEDDIQHMLDKEELFEVPSFGLSTSDYEDVVKPFYDYWTSYNTKKSFVWLDEFNIQQNVPKQVLKLVEKKQKKIRQNAKKEWNEEVRELVAFVRKRDKRVKEYAKLREAKILENRQKNEDLSKQKRLERNKLLNESYEAQADWTKFDNVKNELEQIEKSLAEEFGEQISEHEEDEEDTDYEESNLYCVACNKIFKSPKAFENHELSKKHKENVSRLKETMEEDLSGNESESSPDKVVLNGTDEISSEEQELTGLSVGRVAKLSKQKRKQKNTKTLTRESISEDNEVLFDVSQEAKDFDDFKLESFKRKHKSKKSKVNNTESVRSSSATDILSERDLLSDDGHSLEETNKDTRTLNKNAKQPRDNKEESNSANANICLTCKANFSSKNKLFSHLKKTGHSITKEPQCVKFGRNKS